MAVKHGLGRGLSALITDTEPEATPTAGDSRRTIPIDQLTRNSRQPRHSFDEGSLAELAASIREHGVIQPLLVRKAEDGYQIIAGERRLRAAGRAGLSEVPVIVMEAPDRMSLELALIENLQRENLNPIDEAEGYMSLAGDFGLTHEQVAERLGKSRAAVSNSLRLLNLPEEVKELVRNGTLSTGHAKLLSGLEIAQEQINLAHRIVAEGLTVRALEKIIKKLSSAPRKPRASRDDMPASHAKELADHLQRHLGTAVRIESCKTLANGRKRKGKIEIEYYSNEDLDRILNLLGADQI